MKRDEEKKVEALINRTLEIAKSKLRTIRERNGDIEDDHIDADNILCELLEFFHAGEVVEEYKKITKYYA